jgi:hypothetical protein
MRTILEGNARTTYYRPRLSPDTMRIAASMIDDDGRWRVVVADKAGRAMRDVGPDDGANRYDAQWLNDDTLVVVSERGGIPNLELLSVADGGARAVTRVTGAAVAPEVNRRDGSRWFLSLHSLGFDVRRVTGAPADTVVSIDAERFGFAGARTARPAPLAASDAAPTRRYESPRHERLLPGAYGSADGAGLSLSLYSGDIVGRFTGVATAAFGEQGAWRGGSVRMTSRRRPAAVELGIFAAAHDPSRGRSAVSDTTGIDQRSLQVLAAFGSTKRGDGWQWKTRLGVGGGKLEARGKEPIDRTLGFLESDLFTQQVTGARGLAQSLRLHVAAGQSGQTYQRAVATIRLATAGRDLPRFEVIGTAGRLFGSPHRFELFAVGGGVSPVVDSALLRQRFAIPMLPTAIAMGSSLIAWRVAYPGAATLFFEGAGAAPDFEAFPTWHRAVGVERRFAYGPVPLGFLPRVEIRAGGGILLDPPFRRKVRVFGEIRFEP